MKQISLFAVMGGVLMVFWLTGTALAFHDGGVAHCDGCHSMHNSVDGAPDEDVAGGSIGTGINENLTKGTDPSSTCLNCHEGNGSYHIASGDPTLVNYNAGGDFSWLLNDYTWTRHNEPGARFGHNIRASDFGYEQDDIITMAPGGTYPADALGCTSCHDPHGKVNGQGGLPIADSGSYGEEAPPGAILGNYRLLGDSGYVAPDMYNVPPSDSGYDFSDNAPIATATNAGGFYGSSVAYGSGVSEWCANCHTAFVADGSTAHRHPAGQDAHLSMLFATNYNTYVATGDMTGVNNYDGVVPIESGGTDRTLLNPDDPAPGGVDQSWNVMCLTCHRAHASGFTNMTRWDMNTELLSNSHPTTGDGGYPAGRDPHAGYYVDGASFDPTVRYSPFQRSLCNKCHVQDTGTI